MTKDSESKPSNQSLEPTADRRRKSLHDDFYTHCRCGPRSRRRSLSLFSLDRMRAPLVVMLLLGVSAVARASGNSVEVTLEDTLEQQQKETLEQQQKYRRWHFTPKPQDHDSDSHFEQWRFKFNTASEKRLGNAKDEIAIKSVLSDTSPIMIRWVSPRVVVVEVGGLKVLEKEGSKWKITHRYRPRIYLPTI